MLWNIFSNTPTDFFSNPIWLFFSGIGGIAAILIIPVTIATTILVYRWQLKRKEIAYQIISNAPIIDIDEQIEDRVEIFLDGKKVKDVNLFVIKVWNSGNTSVKQIDFWEPFALEFGQGTVIGTKILETNPGDLLNEQTQFLVENENSLQLTPFSLNPNDSILFSVLLAGQAIIHKKGRIDQGNIVNYNEYLLKRYNSRRFFTGIVYGVWGIIFMPSFIIYLINPKINVNDIIFTITGALSIPIMLHFFLTELFFDPKSRLRTRK